ncbi:carboxypeptidase M32 [Roseimaritima sediminicola]|uniref:carboxypeptidase M32 n=1 Tax=Roseimaritima sediminicola TaxID=2662066 RepID=UPI00129839F5|nr:carboxypeptidase M32 [Roseimaritima sediminicola]
MKPEQRFSALRKHFHEVALLSSTADALEWDERTGLPSAAGQYRAAQVTLLRGMVHRRKTDPLVGEHLGHLADSPLAADPESDEGATVRRLQEDYRREQKLPVRLVEALAEATVLGQQKWDAARRADDFDAFLPALQQMLALKCEAADHLRASGQSRYDALMEEFEPGASTVEIAAVFAELRARLVPLVQAISEASRQPDVDLLRREFPIDQQRAFSRFAAQTIGFDFTRGRLDETSHPFCTSLGPDDSRILTRYEPNWFPTGLFGTLHEAGHGIYEQGLRADWYGLPPGSYVSLGIHESQSRLWENLVGRSLAFWRYLFPHAQQAFPSSLGDASLEQMHFAVNAVRPSLIRVEADEATYNLHVIIRFELEQQLVSGELAAEDLPEAWNARYREFLGVESPTAADGVLQDVHWSAGLFGYFPTYALGNLCAAQLFEAATDQLGDIDRAFADGDTGELLQWLRTRIHRPGRVFDPAELIQRATGKPLSSDPLIKSLTDRYTPLYHL